jgi:alpha-amylase
MKKIVPIIIAIFLGSTIPAYAADNKEGRLWQDETVYSIMIDRFYDGDTKNDIDTNSKDPNVFNGGDFQGIIDKLDYIHDMGFTAIRLTPIFANSKNGYHGYWVKDFYKTDEHFGSIETFQKLVSEAHKRNMKVVIDFVANNVATDHPWVNDSGKQDWFHKRLDIHDWNNQQEVENGWVDGLPDLNQDNPEVKKYLIDAADWWIRKTNIDGYSLPEVNNVPVSFWRDFSKAVKQEKKDFFLLGIPADKTSPNMKIYENAGIDSMLNDQHSNHLRNFFATTDQSFGSLNSDIKKMNEQFKQPFLMANFFDNENTPRFTKDIVDKRQFPGARWQTALVYLYTTPGIPVVFYGSEIALNGGEIPDNRGQMSFRANKDLIDFITSLAKLRNQLPSLTRGSMEMLFEKNGMVVYKRIYKGETSIIAINNTSKSQNVTLTENQIVGGKELRGLLTGDLVRSKDHKYDLIIDRDKAEIYVLTNKSGLNFTMIGSLVVVYLLTVLFIWRIKKRK